MKKWIFWLGIIGICLGAAGSVVGGFLVSARPISLLRWAIFLVGILGGFMGALLALIGLYLKETQTQQANAQPQQPTMTSKVCPFCDKSLAWIPDRQQFYCYQCKKLF